MKFEKQGVIICLALLVFFLNGCASKNYRDIRDTDETRQIKTDTTYSFLVGEPTLKEPFINFRLIQTQTYQGQKKQNVKHIKESGPGGLMQLTLLPLDLACAIVTLGEHTVSDAFESEKVVGSENRWKDIDVWEESKGICGVEVHLSYRFLQEDKEIVAQTNERGEIIKDLRNLARSVNEQLSPQDYIEFVVRVPRLDKDKSGRIKVPRSLLIDIYNKWKDDGFYCK